MGMNPETNRFEELTPTIEEALVRASNEHLAQKLATLSELQATGGLLRSDGSPVPKHWSVFRVGEVVTIKDYNFQVAYIGETSILFEPMGPVLLGASANPE